MTRFYWTSGLFLFLNTIEFFSPNCLVEGVKCKPETFYLPYVHVRRKKHGGNIASLRSSGFMDLRFRNRAMLCINGPVVLYSGVERLEPDARLTSKSDQSSDTLKSYPEGRNPGPDHGIADLGPNDEELKFTKPEIAVFDHECIPINRIPHRVLKKMKRDQGRSNPELMGDTQVIGRLVLGVFLIGNKDGYNLPELGWFKGPNFEYLKTKDRTVKDSSFVLSGTNTSYCMRLPDGMTVRISVKDAQTQTNAHQICRWHVTEEEKKVYSMLFQRGFDSNGVRNGEQVLKESDYDIFECPGEEGGDNAIILDMAKTTPAPVTHVNYTEFDPFSLFNPNLWTPHGYRKDSNGLSGGDERFEDRSMSSGVPQDDTISCSVEPHNPDCVETDLDFTTIRDMQNVAGEGGLVGGEVMIHTGECINLPVYHRCFGSANYGHRLLELKLELEPLYKKPEGDEPNAKAHMWNNLNDNSTMIWKYDFLYLTAEIFSRLCMPFPKEMPFTIARIFAWYVYRAHLFGWTMGRPNKGDEEEHADFAYPLYGSYYDNFTLKNDMWPFLIKELERCNEVAKKENGGQGLKFQWENGEDTGKWKIPASHSHSDKKRRKKRSEGEDEAKLKRRPVRKAYETLQESSCHTEDEVIEEIIAEPGEKILSRKKRAGYYKVNGSVITTKYIQPGKSLAWVKSEGTWGYVREPIQEYKKKPDLNDPRADADKYLDYPENIHHCWNPKVDPVTREVVCSKTEELFFYEEAAELKFELNIAIDMWWKIWLAVIGYCNKAYHSRKSETFPRMYHLKYEYFFDPIKTEWFLPEDNYDLQIILSEYLTEESEIWLDSCLEGAYVNSNSQSFRPPRPPPLGLEIEPGPNYFIEIPDNLYYRFHPEPNDGI